MYITVHNARHTKHQLPPLCQVQFSLVAIATSLLPPPRPQSEAYRDLEMTSEWIEQQRSLSEEAILRQRKHFIHSKVTKTKVFLLKVRFGALKGGGGVRAPPERRSSPPDRLKGIESQVGEDRIPFVRSRPEIPPSGKINE